MNICFVSKFFSHDNIIIHSNSQIIASKFIFNKILIRKHLLSIDKRKVIMYGFRYKVASVSFGIRELNHFREMTRY